MEVGEGVEVLANYDLKPQERSQIVSFWRQA